jgi:hypothetical protein
MIRRKGRGHALRRLLRVAVACLVLVGHTPDGEAGAIGDPAGFSGSLVLSSFKPGLEADSHHAAVGHGGAVHCVSSSGCISAAVLPEAAVLLIGKLALMLIRADLSSHCWDTLPPLHPPNLSNLG